MSVTHGEVNNFETTVDAQITLWRVPSSSGDLGKERDSLRAGGINAVAQEGSSKLRASGLASERFERVPIGLRGCRVAGDFGPQRFR